ncbi:MAG TPA: hypothetical protein VGT41_05685 [Candidatus Babeliales bacterium]|nr:hypothetical protein [Candidatus Babeliales bacterium]
MLKKTLAVLLLISLQVQAAPDSTPTLNDAELEFFSRSLPAAASEILRKRKCKCFECLKATCAVIDTLAVTNLTVGGVSVNNALTIDNTFISAYTPLPTGVLLTVLAGAPLPFDNVVLASGITHPDVFTFVLPAVGTYEVTWQSPTETVVGALLLEVAGINVTRTSVGSFAIGGETVGNTYITTTAANTTLRVISEGVLNLTPVLFPLSMTISIRRVA